MRGLSLHFSFMFGNFNEVLSFDWIELFSILLLVVVGIIFSILMCYRVFQGFQLNDYKFSRFFKWLVKTRSKLLFRLSMVAILSTLVTIASNLLFHSFMKDYSALLGIVVACAFMATFVIQDAKKEQKTPLKVTARVVRQYIVLSIICSVSFTCVFLWLDLDNFYYLKGLVFSLLPLIMVVFCVITFLVLEPFEQLNKAIYIAKARTKVKRVPCKVVAITGSYGKTTIKNMVYDLVKNNMKAVKSPLSYNTPMGITRTILQELKQDTEVLILEMGARKVGDVQKLCGIAAPDIAVVTALGEQHMEYFKTKENIKLAKSEIIKYAKSNSVAIIGDESAYEIFKETKGKKIFVPETVAISNVNITKNATKFTMCWNEKETCDVETPLIGEHCVQNIAIATEICMILGMEFHAICDGISKLTQTEHRFQVRHETNNITVIDDSYNTNPHSAIIALETVDKIAEGEKIIVTPGYVELGELQDVEQEKLGERIAEVFNKVILVGAIQTKMILQGLKNSGFNMENVYTVCSQELVNEQLSQIVKEGATVLLLNDLPDSYAENL